MSLKVNIKLENFIGRGNGVYSAYFMDINSLKKYTDIMINEYSDEECDIIHYHSIGFGYLRSAMLHKQKTLVTAHVVPDSFAGSIIFSRYWQNPAKEYLRLAFQRARSVLAVSPQVKIDLQDIGVTRPIYVVPNCIDRSIFRFDNEARQNTREHFGIGPNEFVVLGAGQIQPRKGIIDFVETARRMPQLTFVWAGGRPYGKLTADFSQMNQVIESAPENIKFIGQLEIYDMPSLYSLADVYFLPSYHENFAFATIEAASVKLPLLLRDIDAYKNSLFTNYIAGNNVEDFVNTLVKLTKEQTYFEKYRTLSNELAEKYNIVSHCQKLLEIYQTVALGNKTNRRRFGRKIKALSAR